MIAQVNLYQPQFRRKHLRLSFNRMIILTGLILSTLTLQVIISNHEIDLIEDQAKQVQQTIIHTNNQWSHIQTRFPRGNDNTLLSAEEEKMKTILDNRNQLMKLIKDSRFNPHMDQSGYSDYMIAFARQHLPDLWLTNVGIVNRGDQIVIEGKTLNAQSIPEYLQRLSTEPVLAGTQLEILKIDQGDIADDITAPLNFSLATYRDSYETK